MKLPRINVYNCQYGCIITTVDVDEGVTPFRIKCRSKPRKDRPLNSLLMDEYGECKGMANSSFYPKVPLPNHFRQPEWQWEKQSESSYQYEADRHGVSVDEIKKSYHASKSQLILVPRTDREPLYHDSPTTTTEPKDVKWNV